MARLGSREYFGDYFGVDAEALREHAAFNIPLNAQLPLFVDPFLLYASDRPEYRLLHDHVLNYAQMLVEIAGDNEISNEEMERRCCFPAPRHFRITGVVPSYECLDFSLFLSRGLGSVFSGAAESAARSGVHLETIALLNQQVKQEEICGFVIHVIRDYLLEYTQDFARKYLSGRKRRVFEVEHAHFDFELQCWQRDEFDLPSIGDDYVLLIPEDMLSAGKLWISRESFVASFSSVLKSIEDADLRMTIHRLVDRSLSDHPDQREVQSMMLEIAKRFPILVDSYVRGKERSVEIAIESCRLKRNKI